MSQIRRSHPLLRGLLLLYLASTFLLAAGHQHRGSLQGHDCSLCTVAHTPATVATGLDHEIEPLPNETPLTIPADLGWDSESLRTTRSRAPPLA